MVRHGLLLASLCSVPLAPPCRRGWSLAETGQALDNATVEVDEFGFGELVYINAHGGLAGWVLASTGMNSVPVIGLQQAALLVFFAADTRAGFIAPHVCHAVMFPLNVKASVGFSSVIVK